MKSIKNGKPESSASPAKQLAGFIDKFEPAIAKLTRSSLAILRKRFATATELVYDNYNALAIGWSPNGRTSEAIVSIAVYASGVNLFFLQGARLSDPRKILEGEGKQVRFVRLDTAERINDPAVADLLDAAIRLSKTPLPVSGKRQTVIKSISAKQRPRRRESGGAARRTAK